MRWRLWPCVTSWWTGQGSELRSSEEGRARSRDEIREHMSGNLCRCGAYPNIVDAIEEVLAGRAGTVREAAE